ncbi:beta-ketoacyl-[acyl-carrier-protein] synthase family protein [Lactiplantibacillus plantarum]
MNEVVITGIGIVTPMGIGKEKFWENDFSGKSFITENTEMEENDLKSNVSCKLANFDVQDYLYGHDLTELKDEARFSQFGFIAGNEAIIDSNILLDKHLNKSKVGVIFSSAIGGTPEIQDVYEKLTDKGKHSLRYQSIGEKFYNDGMFNYPATLISHKFNFSNICASLSTGCTAGMDAMGAGRAIIQNGEANIILAGANEAPLSLLTYSTLDSIGALSKWKGDPSAASRPFDKKRKGFVISEGSCVLVLEEKRHAVDRGAHIYAEITSYASHNNAQHMTDLKDSETLEKTISDSLKEAKLVPSDIDYINAHGSSTRQNDQCESDAIRSIFGKSATSIPVNSTKSMMGHPLSAASLIAMTSVLGVIKYSEIPKNINLEYPDEDCNLNLPVKNIKQNVENAMVMASGFGGIHSVCTLKKFGAC